MSSKKETKQEVTPYQELLEQNQALLTQNRLLQNELQSLKMRLAEAEELKRAISEGDLDALVIHSPEGELIFTLDSADRAYRALVETMNEGTVTLASDDTILYCNRQFAELLRTSSQSIVGSSIHRFIKPENAAIFEALLKYGKSSEEISLRAVDGASVPVYLSISSLKEEKSPNAWCLVFTDLTEQKKSEEIIASERLARSIIEQAAKAIIVCDVSGRIIRFSKSVPKLCGCNPLFQRFEDIIDLKFSEGTDGGKRILPISSALSGSTILGIEVTFESSNHQMFNLLLNSGSLKNDNGEIIGCVVTLTDITEQKQAEEALKISEKNFRSIFESSKMGIIVGDLEGRVVQSNPAAERMLGYEKEELRNKKLAEFTYLEDLSIEMPLILELIAGKRDYYEIEKRYIRKDGQIIWIRFIGTTFLGNNGETNDLALIEDITERKKAEKALQESETKYHGLFDSMAEAFELMELVYENGKPVDYIFLDVNPAWERMTGLKKEQVLGLKASEVVGFVESYWPEAMDRALRTGKMVNLENYGVALDRWYSVNMWKFSETACGVTITDITESKKAEEALRVANETLDMRVQERTEELQKAYNLLKESEKRFRIAVKNTNLVLSQFDLNLRYAWIYNPHPDFDPSSLVGKRGDEVESSDGMQRLIALKRQVLESGKGIHEDISFSRSDGIHTYDTIIEPLYNDTGDIIGGTASALDITKRRRAEEALAKIEEARIKEIHHRIKNNLQVISSLLDLEAEKFTDLKVLNSFKESQNRVASMALIHEELYKGKESDDLDFAAYIRKLIANLLDSYNLKNDGISLKLNIEEIYLDMDTAIPLGIIVNELFSNSLKHAFVDGKQREININLQKVKNSESGNRCKENNFNYVLIVADNGKGIPKEIKIENADTLGLQLVNILVNQIDGCIELKRNQGTEFTILFSNIVK